MAMPSKEEKYAVTNHAGVPLSSDSQSAAFGILRAKEAQKEGGAMEFRIKSAEALFVRRMKDDDSISTPLWTETLLQYGYEIALEQDGFALYSGMNTICRVDDDPYRSALCHLLINMPVPLMIEVTGQEFPHHMLHDPETDGGFADMIIDGDIAAPVAYQKMLLEKRKAGTYGQGAERMYFSDTVVPLQFNTKSAAVETMSTRPKTAVQLADLYNSAYRSDATITEFVAQLSKWEAPLRVKQKLLESPEYAIKVPKEVKAGFMKEEKGGWVRVRNVPPENKAAFLVHALRASTNDTGIGHGIYGGKAKAPWNYSTTTRSAPTSPGKRLNNKTTNKASAPDGDWREHTGRSKTTYTPPQRRHGAANGKFGFHSVKKWFPHLDEKQAGEVMCKLRHNNCGDAGVAVWEKWILDTCLFDIKTQLDGLVEDLGDIPFRDEFHLLVDCDKEYDL
jgi:hypothetical protein